MRERFDYRAAWAGFWKTFGGLMLTFIGFAILMAAIYMFVDACYNSRWWEMPLGPLLAAVELGAIGAWISGEVGY